MRKRNKFTTGLLAIGLIGYLVGLLTSPRSGKENIKNIKSNIEYYKDDIEKKLKSVHTELHSVLIEASRSARSAKSEIKEKLTTLIDKAGTAKDDVRSFISMIHEGDDIDDEDLEKALKVARKSLRDLKRYLKDTNINK